MKTLFIFFLGFLITSLFSFQKTNLSARSKWVISQNSSLIVNGRTNINRFSCAILQYPKTDTVFITQDKVSKVILSGALNIEVKNFDCSNVIMTKQLRKTLQADRFPNLQIRFLSLREAPSLNQPHNFIKGYVEITIAGVAKKFEICYQINIERNEMTLIGNQPINFSDFKLVAPKKIGRLIQAKDELIVAFFLKMELVGTKTT